MKFVEHTRPGNAPTRSRNVARQVSQHARNYCSVTGIQ